MKHLTFSFTRRTIIFSVLLLVVFSLHACSKKPETKSVTVVSWGGKYQDALFDSWVLPTAKKMGVQIQGRSYNGEYDVITRMVQSGAVTWDLVQVETFYAAQAANKGLLNKFLPPIPRDKIALKEGFLSLDGYAYPTIGWSYALAWNQDVLEKVRTVKREPNGWKDFWDFKTFPGKRSLRDVPQGNIEIALMADGMTIEEVNEDLYVNQNLKLLDRAFTKLNELKGEVVWWSSGDRIQQELESGGVTLAATWNGRVWTANKNPILTNKKPDIRISYEQAILDYDWWIIPKGSKRAAIASELVYEMYNNVNGAATFSKTMGYGPPIKGWENQLDDKELIECMPTTQKNIDLQLTTNPNFWAEHNHLISDRWSKWRAE